MSPKSFIIVAPDCVPAVMGETVSLPDFRRCRCPRRGITGVGSVGPMELGLPGFDIRDRFPQVQDDGMGTEGGSRRRRMRVDKRSALRSVSRRWWPELVVGLLAGLIF